MDMDDFQRAARTTAVYPAQGENLVYPVLGLAGEAGELAGKLSKAIRDDGGEVHPERREALVDELGDVLWFVAQVATELQVGLDEVARRNLDKLAARRERGVLGGSGDGR